MTNPIKLFSLALLVSAIACSPKSTTDSGNAADNSRSENAPEDSPNTECPPDLEAAWNTACAVDGMVCPDGPRSNDSSACVELVENFTCVNGAWDWVELTRVCEDPEDEPGEETEITIDPLSEVFELYFDSSDEWVIHDPSAMVRIGDYLMIGVTGKANEDGYDCGLETWYMDRFETAFRPGQCLLRDKPAWIDEEIPSNDGAYWAPGMLGTRTMYYTVPGGDAMEDGEDASACIGMLTATGDPPNLVWTDHGAPITCTFEAENNTDDPEPGTIDAATFIDDDGTHYLIYGGGHIWSTILDSDTGEQIDGDFWDADGDSYFHLANGPTVDEDGEPTDEEEWIEAPFMMKRGDYYYLFVNWYACCQGEGSTYEIRVGRSNSATGPFVDSSGVSMLDGGGHLLVDSSFGVIGPGHAGILTYENASEEPVHVLSFHHYMEDGVPWAYLGTRVLKWTEDDWPELTSEAFVPTSYWNNAP